MVTDNILLHVNKYYFIFTTTIQPNMSPAIL